MPRKEKRWFKFTGSQSLYYGHPQIEPAIATVFRTNKYVSMKLHCNPKTGKPWKSMTEAREWMDKHV